MHPIARRLLKGVLWLLLWTFVAFFFYTQDVSKNIGQSYRPGYLLRAWLISLYIWAVLGLLVIRLSRELPIERSNWLQRVPIHLFLSFGVALAAISLDSILAPRLGIYWFPADFRITFLMRMSIGLHRQILTYWCIAGVWHCLHYYQRLQQREADALRLQLRASELDRRLAQAQLGALQMQLHPHFLFNTLNSVMVLLRGNQNAEAEKMLSLLSELLRRVLDEVDTQEIPLRKELEYLDLYLAIEQVRFQDRLKVEVSASPEVLDVFVPYMCLQPIVENAIRHGIGKSSRAGKVAIRAERSGATVTIQVRDDGPGIVPTSNPERRGIGLANTRARLDAMYGKAGQLWLGTPEEGGTVATIVVPVEG